MWSYIADAAGLRAPAVLVSKLGANNVEVQFYSYCCSVCMLGAVLELVTFESPVKDSGLSD